MKPYHALARFGGCLLPFLQLCSAIAQQPLQAPLAATAPLIALHRALVDIESTTGNEFDVGSYLLSHLASLNFTIDARTVDQLDPDRPRFNVLAYRGPSRNSRILVTSHIDTVPPYYPYTLQNDTTIWGRGSVDAKAAVAAQITAVNELLASDEIGNGDVALLFVVGEEVNGDGMRAANALGLEWEAVVFGEPTELKLAAGHKGMAIFEVRAHGKAGHSGYPWLGESANSLLISALVALSRMELPASEKYGNSTLNIGRMEGGVAANVIAEEARATVAVRLAAGTPEEIRAAVREVVSQVDERLEVEFLIEGYGPVDIDHDVDGKRAREHQPPTLADWIQGFETIICNYGTDINGYVAPSRHIRRGLARRER